MPAPPHPWWSDDIIKAFTAPATISFARVPNTVATPTAYITAMQQNLQAEYALFLHEATKAATRWDAPWLDAEIQCRDRHSATLWLPEPDKAWHLASVKSVSDSRSILCVISPSPAADHSDDGDAAHTYTLKTAQDIDALFPANHTQVHDTGPCKVCLHGYIGSNMQQHEAWQDLDPATPILRCIRDPTASAPGHYVQADEPPPPTAAAANPLNACQERAIAALARSVELIHGPPGTGKSTTIFHLIRTRLPADAKVIVTCSRNGAVDSITQKLRGLEVPDAYYIQVLGNEDLIGPTAQEYLLPSQVERDASISPLRAALEQAKSRVDLVKQFPAWAVPPPEVTYEQHLPACFACPPYWAMYTQAQQAHNEALQALHRQRTVVEAKIKAHTRVYLCTIATTDRVPGNFAAHTCIVDEAGCTSEMELGILLHQRPTNMVLIGDHKQLPPFSRAPAGAEPPRSFFKRAMDAGGPARAHFLATQYRMPAALAGLVSRVFYDGQLVTAVDRSAAGLRPVMFVPVDGAEETRPNATSKFNPEECEAVARAVRALVQYTQARPDGPCQSIGVLTMYRQQRQELQDELAHWGPRVRVLTVDGAQGLEFDVVVLSTVCTRYSRFLDDGPRVNVAISRARFALAVVGHQPTLVRTRFLRQVARGGAVVVGAADVA